LLPVPVLGEVSPAPLVGRCEIESADAPVPPLGLDEPQAAAISTTETAPRTAINPRVTLRILGKRLSKTATFRTSNLLIRAARGVAQVSELGLATSTIGSSDYRPLTDG
jgi:hypothetical protein